MMTRAQGGTELSGQELPLATTGTNGGIRGMDVTVEELREVGKGLCEVAIKHLDRSRPQNQDVDPLLERGALVETLLALGVGVEPTVRGAVANHAYLATLPARPDQPKRQVR